jgi:hypothetical protein
MIKTTCSLIALALGLCATTAATAQSSGLKVINQYAVGGDGNCDYITLDATAQKIYVAHGAAISALDLKNRKATPHLADATGRIYLPTAELGVPDAETGKPTIVPNTFMVFVVGK